jgi:anti-sigma factor RsiW
VIALDCRAVVELVSAYVDQELEADAHRRVGAHLAGCDGCEQYVDQVRQTVGLVGRLACRGRLGFEPAGRRRVSASLCAD